MNQAITHTHADRGGEADRWTVWVRWASVFAAVVGLLLVMSVLPVGEAIERLESWITSLGVWGPAVFAALYVVATVLMLPGWALTLAAGAIFGLWIGLATVSVGSTTGAAGAFLISRYLARDKITRRFGGHPKFRAIDRAVGEGGWKIVAMLRLSPVVPFNVQNYLYGLTAIRFWPAVLASWVAMLPGTFLYVYLGYAGRQAAGGITGGGPGGVGRVAMIGVGMVATLILIFYLTRLSTRAIRSHTQVLDLTEEIDVTENRQGQKKPIGKWGVIAMTGLAVVVLGAGVYARIHPQMITGLLSALAGPPAVAMTEAYDKPAADQEGVFDHSPFDAILSKHVDADGWVDYGALAEDAEGLDTYIASLADAPFDALGRDEKLAYLINAYNAFTLRLILDHYPIKSIKDIPSAKRWDAKRWGLAGGNSGGGGTYSLNQIEHELIRPKFVEPRIHFALVCAAYSCPKLRNEAYTGEQLEAQLRDQAVYTHTHDRWFRFDQAKDTVYLTALYNWYGGDFESVADSVLDYVADQVPDLRASMDSGRVPKVRWLDYDWKLNDVHNAP